MENFIADLIAIFVFLLSLLVMGLIAANVISALLVKREPSKVVQLSKYRKNARKK